MKHRKSFSSWRYRYHSSPAVMAGKLKTICCLGFPHISPTQIKHIVKTYQSTICFVTHLLGDLATWTAFLSGLLAKQEDWKEWRVMSVWEKRRKERANLSCGFFSSFSLQGKTKVIYHREFFKTSFEICIHQNMDIALYRIFLCNDNIVVDDKRDTYRSFAHSTNTSWVQRTRGRGMLQYSGWSEIWSEWSGTIPLWTDQPQNCQGISRNSATIMTYLKILEKMPDQCCIWPRCPVEEDLTWPQTVQTWLTGWQVLEGDGRRDSGHLMERKSTRGISLAEWVWTASPADWGANSASYCVRLLCTAERRGRM